MNTLVIIIIATFLVSLGALVGAVTILLNEKRLKQIILFLISLSAGTLIGGAFFHLIPESLERMPENMNTLFWLVIIGFIIFFLVEKILRWRHCHDSSCQEHQFVGHLSLVGDGIHNFIDGLLIAASFVADYRLGIATTIAVIFHEIPQEVGDFGLLLHSGFKKGRALFLNFSVALIVVLGGIIGYLFSSRADSFINFALPFTAGGFLYIAASDLIPEIRKENRAWFSIATFLTFIFGLLLMYFLKKING
ncbi:MAG: ZIP family metal transporter [Patescibacteria group bacterium]|nr:ZIP family metal transporter [Patescibacteria group bacterium]MBU2509014.1 ZIP family metal transporter [Patescibacteria group bacterium]